MDSADEREDESVVTVKDLARFFANLLVEAENDWGDAFFSYRVVSAVGEAVGDVVLE